MTQHDDLASAKRTIDKEVEALHIMENELNGNLEKALDLMQNTKGRVIITGMGNPGTSAIRLRQPWPRPERRHFLFIPAKPATATSA